MTDGSTQLTWEGRPAGSGSRRWFDWVISLFALMLMAVAVVFCTITIWTGSPELVTAYGVLVFCFGVWFLMGRRLGRRRRRRGSRYGIGDGKLTLSIAGHERVIPLGDLTEVTSQAHRDGTATVWARVADGPMEPLLEAVNGVEEALRLLAASDSDEGDTVEPG